MEDINLYLKNIGFLLEKLRKRLENLKVNHKKRWIINDLEKLREINYDIKSLNISTYKISKLEGLK